MNRGSAAIGLFSIAMFVFGALIFMPTPVKATPPASVKLLYNKGGKMLKVTIIHNNGGKSSHFIKFIEIKKNGAVVSIKNYNAQPAPLMFTYEYRINAIEEDALQAFVTCSEGQTGTSPVLTVAP